jgi:hypothetical protein
MHEGQQHLDLPRTRPDNSAAEMGFALVRLSWSAEDLHTAFYFFANRFVCHAHSLTRDAHRGALLTALLVLVSVRLAPFNLSMLSRTELDRKIDGCCSCCAVLLSCCDSEKNADVRILLAASGGQYGTHLTRI